MRSSLKLAFLALMCCVVHGFSSPTKAPRNVVLGDRLFDKLSRVHVTPRGGARGLKAVPVSTGTKCPATGVATIAASIWGAGGVIYILAKAIKRVLPIALEPFQAGAVPLNKVELGYEK
jgi:hypothetical protein